MLSFAIIYLRSGTWISDICPSLMIKFVPVSCMKSIVSIEKSFSADLHASSAVIDLIFFSPLQFTIKQGNNEFRIRPKSFETHFLTMRCNNRCAEHDRPINSCYLYT